MSRKRTQAEYVRKVVFSRANGRAKKNLRFLELARERGVTFEEIARAGGKTDGRRKVYFGRVLTPDEEESLVSYGMEKSAQGWIGFKWQIPQWVWEMRTPYSPKIGAKPLAPKDLVWEPGKKAWP